MKKIISSLFVAGALIGLASCEKEEIGGTAVQDMCGEWIVTADAVDANGNVVYEDPYGAGVFELYTYNTNANLSTEMYVDDFGSFWDFRIIVNVDYAAKTFNATGAIDDYWDISVDVKDGAIVKNGTKSPAGYVADSISFKILFEDDDNAADGEYAYLWIHGYRRTGLDGGYD